MWNSAESAEPISVLRLKLLPAFALCLQVHSMTRLGSALNDTSFDTYTRGRGGTGLKSGHIWKLTKHTSENESAD